MNPDDIMIDVHAPNGIIIAIKTAEGLEVARLATKGGVMVIRDMDGQFQCVVMGQHQTVAEAVAAAPFVLRSQADAMQTTDHVANLLKIGHEQSNLPSLFDLIPHERPLCKPPIQNLLP